MSGQQHFGAPEHLRQSQAPWDSLGTVDHSSEGAKRSIRRDPPPLPAALVPSEDELQLRLAEELEYARRLLDAMGDELAADMGVIMRHSVALQSVDIVGQMIGHIANVVRSSDPNGAVERIGMCELKARLQRHRL
ncbi:MAG: hypothetical protein LH465_08035 [Sphingomonas bacterium]|nr:hypothetical protein [Sphingomonas bacterium]